MARRTGPGALARRIERAVGRALAGRPVVLAVSGGRDSMALLHAAARATTRRSVACVATFDHGTGEAATEACALAARVATALGFEVVTGHASSAGRTEAEWRDARLAFLADVAERRGASVATAHTLDDQLETVLMRILRDAGARGIAGLYASAPRFVRPLIDVTRAELAEYAGQVDATWVEDPTNTSPRHFRNRVRRDLLPALSAAAPEFPAQLLALSRTAADLRSRVDAMAASISEVSGESVEVSAETLERFDADELRVMWPALASRVGVVLDWRGTRRAAAFTTSARAGSRMPLSGGWEIARTRDRFDLRRSSAREPIGAVPLQQNGARFDAWKFVATRSVARVSDEWVAQLPLDSTLTVRSWNPGDRMRFGAAGFRKVKRFLSDARISGTRRAQWPVVLAGDDIVWIPGVRRSDAATVRPGRPGVLYRCELDDR